MTFSSHFLTISHFSRQKPQDLPKSHKNHPFFTSTLSPSLGKILKEIPKSPFIHIEINFFYFHPTGPPGNAQMQQCPVRH